MKKKFVICVDNIGYQASLEKWKIYSALSDKKAEETALLRVVDESGESYLYSKNRFVDVELPPSVVKAIKRETMLA